MNLGEMDGRPETGTGVGAGFGQRFCKRVVGGWSVCTVLGERVDGISAHDWEDGDEDAVFYVGGINRVLSGAALADAEQVTTSAAGKAVPAGAGHKVAGLCEQAVSAGDLTTVVRHIEGGNAV